MNKTPQLTAAVFTEILEHMAFLFAEQPAPDELIAFDAPGLLARIAFTGPYNGQIQAASTQKLCLAVACGMMGLDPGNDLP